jgi:hypothetical protein
MITPEEKKARIEDINQHLSSMQITDAVMLPNVWELHRNLLRSDRMCFFMLMQMRDGIKVTDASDNVYEVTGLPRDAFVGKFLHDLEKEDMSNPDDLLSQLQRRAVSKIIKVNGNDFLVLMWKEGHNSYGEYMIKL